VLSLNPHQRYFLYQTVTDMRKGINGLNGLIREYLQQDPMSKKFIQIIDVGLDRICAVLQAAGKGYI
jgi:hypothetical protein